MTRLTDLAKGGCRTLALVFAAVGAVGAVGATSGWAAREPAPASPDASRTPGAATPYTTASLRAIYAGPPSQWPPAWVDADAAGRELAPAPLPPADAAPGRRALGERLFFDARLSAGGAVSCASCHQPAHGWASPDPRAIGHAGQQGSRNAPGLQAAVHLTAWGWDGRHDTLIAASLFALTEPREMANAHLSAVVQRVQADPDYVQAFAAAGEPQIGAEAIGRALASYIAGLDTPTPLDAFLRGDHTRLSDEQVWGLHLFRTQARCLNCHGGPALSDGRFHNLGLVGFDEPITDLGRHGVTGRLADAGAFRTPSLRHVARTAPYMHDGAFRDLTGVIAFYARGGGEVFVRNAGEAAHTVRRHAATVSPHLRPLALTPAQRQALAAFLRAL